MARLNLLWLVVLSAGCTWVTQDQPPNIVLIMADDLGYETLGVNGSTHYKTPHLDQLAQTGMRFTQAHATPLCTPSRVQLMTGKYNFRNYIGFGLLDPEEQTFAHLLRDAGYRTAVVGKWQLYGNARQRELAGRGGSVPEDAGFDEYALWQVKERGRRFWSPTLDISQEGVQSFPDAYGPDLFAEYIGAFMERNRDRPFFLYYPMVLTHDPFQPTPNEGFVDHAVNDTAYFAANVAYMDEVVGRITAHLDRLDLRENTLLLFIGDNGTDRDVTSQVAGKLIRGQKGYPTRAGTHVPMIANWPGIIGEGQVNDNLIDLTDFLPTLMEVAQEDIPVESVTDGLSFFGQLLGKADTTRSWSFCHYDPRWGNFPPRRWAQDKTWKLYDNGMFYHTEDDPDEQFPLADSALDASGQQARQHLQEVLQKMTLSTR